jgi:hypothetical protein
MHKNVSITLAGWKTLDTQNNSLTIDPSEEEEENLVDHYRLIDGRLKQVIYCPNFVTRRIIIRRKTVHIIYLYIYFVIFIKLVNSYQKLQLHVEHTNFIIIIIIIIINQGIGHSQCVPAQNLNL